MDQLLARVASTARRPGTRLGLLTDAIGGVDGHHPVSAAPPHTDVEGVIGDELAEALHGAQVVVDACNAEWDDATVVHFYEASTHSLLTAEAAAGVGHHVVLSVVGAAGLPQSAYFRAKVAQERLIAGSAIPYSIVSATQFFEFMQGIADAATDGDLVRLPPVLTQPIAADDVASALARIAVSAPLNGVVELAGPDTFSLDELIRDLLDSHEDPRKVITDPNARYFGIAPSERALLPGSDARLGTTRFEDWSGGATTQLPQPVLVNGT